MSRTGRLMPKRRKIKRLILNFPGFEPTSSIKQIERLTHGGRKAADLWGFRFERTELTEDGSGQFAVAGFHSAGDSWDSEARFVQFAWSDVISVYENASYPGSLWKNLPKYLSFFFDGSVIRYWKASQRYWGFTIYPLLLMILFAIAAYWIGTAATAFLGLPAWIGYPVALALWLVFCKIPGDYVYVNLSINDWGFARDMCNQSNPSIEERYALFAKRLQEELATNSYDEVLIVGHSFGAVWATAALSHALADDPDLIKNHHVTFLALGSSLMKIALVPEAEFLRSDIRRIASEEKLLWHEIQTKTDFISFYKSDPFPVLGIENAKCRYQVHRVNFKNALSPERLRKMRKSFYLAHRQYILYADRKVHFDFQLRCFGPWLAAELALQPNLIEGQ